MRLITRILNDLYHIILVKIILINLIGYYDDEYKRKHKIKVVNFNSSII